MRRLLRHSKFTLTEKLTNDIMSSLSFVKSSKPIDMKAKNQYATYRNLRILLQGTALSRFESHASSIGAQTVAHAFSCLDAMMAEIFVLRPDKAIKKIIRETKKPESLTVNHYVNRLQVLNTYLSLLPGNISPLHHRRGNTGVQNTKAQT